MAGIPEFKGEQSTYNPVEINTKSQSFDAFARSFGDAAKFGEEQIVKVETEKSNAQLMTASSSLNDLATQTQIAYVKNPELANQTYEEAQYTADTIKKAAYVNKEDRQQLDYLTSQRMNGLQLKAAEINDKQNKLVIANEYGNKVGGLLAQMEYALKSGDFKQAEILQNTIHDNALAAAKAQAITATQLESVSKATMLAHLQAEKLHKMLGDENATAADLHLASQSLFENADNFSGPSLPIDGHTHYLMTTANSMQTINDQIANKINNRPVNPLTIMNASPAKQIEFHEINAGVDRFNSEISAGIPLSQINARVETLSASKALTTQQRGYIARANAFNAQLVSGNGFYDVMRGTQAGRDLAAQHTAETQALRSSMPQGPELEQALNQKDNQYMLESVNQAYAQHFEPQHIQPLPAYAVQNIQASVSKGGDVSLGLNQLQRLDPRLRPYASNVVKEADQGVALWVAGASLGKADPSFAADLLLSVQDQVGTTAQARTLDTANSSKMSDRKDISFDQTKSDSSRDIDIWNNLKSSYPALKDVYAYLQKMPQGVTAQDGLQTLAIKYIKDQARRANDNGLVNLDQYMKKFADNITKSVPIYRTPKGSVNMADLNLIRTQDADLMMDYPLSIAYGKMKESFVIDSYEDFIGQQLKNKGTSSLGFLNPNEAFSDLADVNRLQVISTPDRRLVVVDSSGRMAVDQRGVPLFDEPYTPEMLHHAEMMRSEIAKNIPYHYGLKEALVRITDEEIKDAQATKGQSKRNLARMVSLGLIKDVPQD